MRYVCDLCSLEGSWQDVAPSLVEWTSGGWAPVTRCRDHVGCRRRVEEAGEQWYVADRTSRPAAVMPTPDPEP